MIPRPFPLSRLRRTRSHESVRALVSETQISASNLIQPLFITAHSVSEPIGSMPGMSRLSPDDLMRTCERAITQGLKAVALFPAITSALKSERGEHAWDPEGLVPTAIRRIKTAFPDLLVMADVALDPYTTHGQDGILNLKGQIENDVTCEALVKQALCLADAGANILGPSDMMDGRIGQIRKELEKLGHTDTLILSYAAKYASAFYGPFRDAVQSAQNLGLADKKTYQMDPANSHEALAEVAQDLAEGADIVLVKPAMPYLDVLYRVKQTFQVPTFAYQVSGEYSMIQQAIQGGLLHPQAGILEALLCIRRAGADAILTYFALNVSTWI